MQFDDPQAQSTAYLILRHLYDGDIIEWPIADDHPQHAVFAAVEAQGYIARWDRIWPLHDRYRLTETGIAAIEAVYRPAGAEKIYDDLRLLNLNPVERRGYLQSAGYDPILWPLLHDPSTHWHTYRTYGSPYYNYFWEDEQPYMRTRHHGSTLPTTDILPDTDPLLYQQQQQQALHLVDLDREAGDATGVAPMQHDLDVS